MVNGIFFKGPDMFAEFGRVSVFCVLERCGVVSVSSLEVVFCKSDVSLSGGVVLMCDSGLVDWWWLEAVSVKWTCDLLSAAASFAVFCVGVIYGVIDVFGWIYNAFVVVVDDLLSVIHAAVTDFDCVTIKDSSEFVVFREMLVY